MSQLERQVEEKKAAKTIKAAQAPAGGTGRLVSFNPNEPQKMAVKSLYASRDDLVFGLGRCLARGIKLSIGYTPASDSFYAIAREVSPDWQKADGISSFHRDIVRVIGTLIYALEEVYPDWPAKKLPGQTSDLDW